MSESIGVEPSVGLDIRRIRPLLQAGYRRALRRNRPILVSAVVGAPSRDPLSFFERGAAVAADRMYWSRPADGFAIAGVGSAWTLTTQGSGRFAQSAATWRAYCADALIEAQSEAIGTGLIGMGGFSFDPQRPAAERWAGFPDGLLILPRFLLTTLDGIAWLTVNTLLDPGSDVEAEAASLMERSSLLLDVDESPAPAGDVEIVSSEDLPAASDWRAAVETVERMVRCQADLAKVVLARESRIHGGRTLNPVSLLRRLSDDYPDCFIFAVARGEKCFLGASPERLVRLRDRQFWTTSLAGSIARGSTPAEDQHLGRALLTSDKDMAEYDVVVRAIREGLAQLSVELPQIGRPSLMKLPNVYHLETPIVSQVADSLTIFDLLECLHPTPAVSGYPNDAALRLIREFEAFDRGWYAGPVGWIDSRSEGEFAVAIRSAILDGRQASAFAGCGIVAGSDPASEYAESVLKLRPILSALDRGVG